MKSGTNSLNLRSSTPFIPASSSAPSTTVWSRASRAAEHWMNRAVAYFAGQGAPRIWEQRDRTGATTFKVYDPKTERSYRFTSEADVRVWLEQRYLQ